MKKALFLLVLVAIFSSLAAFGEDAHLSEPGSAAILARSAFAHGYRHGYEAGYHLGDVDVNMGRPAEVKKVRDASMAYSSSFGPRSSFAQGFRAGLQAGYHDGYAGNDFRAVDDFRWLATHMEDVSSAGQPSEQFDNGLGSGYGDGFAQGQSSPSAPASLDFTSVDCRSSQQGAFCEGYRRGFALGRVDALTLHREYILEASK